MVCLAAAVIAAVIDSSRSIAASALSFTSFGEFWGSYAPESLGKVQETAPDYLSAGAWSFVTNFVLAMPAAVVLMALAICLYAIGYRRANRYGRFASS